MVKVWNKLLQRHVHPAYDNWVRFHEGAAMVNLMSEQEFIKALRKNG